MTQQNWPTRYKCSKCTRITDSYPFGCPNSDCPIKRDMGADIWWQLTVGLPVTVIVIAAFIYILASTGGK